MLELMAVFAVLAAVGVGVGLLALIGGLLKLVLKVAFLPVVLLFGILKVVLAVVVVGLFLTVGLPILLAFGALALVFLPLLVLGALLVGGWHLVAAAV
jgi:hypothetical protein